MAPWTSSLRFRLTLWYSVLLALPLIGFAVAGYVVVAATLGQRTDRFIGDALTAFAGEVSAERRTALSAEAAIRNTMAEVRFRDLHLTVLGPDGRPVATTPVPDSSVQRALMARLAQGDPAGSASLTLDGGPGAYRIIAHPLPLAGRTFRLAGAYSLRDTEELLARIRAMFLVAIPFLILAAAAGGYLLARRSLAPVASMAARAATITATNLDQRLPVEGGAELVGLARVVNDLLDRLERAFAQQRRFMADASHELRTPAAVLRTEADVTLSRDHRAEAEYRASATVMQDAARRLTRIVDELFLLARADAGHLIVHKEPIYLEDLVHDAVRAVQSVAERRGVRIELGELVEAPFLGDADLLGRLLLNLLDNAIKFSPRGGTVSVAMRRDPGTVAISVLDPGPGVPAEARDQIFERWFRVDAARSRTERSATSGAGLGLSIARRIAEMHAGRLELVESRPGRTEFRLTLPVASAV